MNTSTIGNRQSAIVNSTAKPRSTRRRARRLVTVSTAIGQPRVFTAEKDDVINSPQFPGLEFPVREIGDLIAKVQGS